MERKSRCVRVKYALMGVSLLCCLGLVSCGEKEKGKPQIYADGHAVGQVCEQPVEKNDAATARLVENKDASVPASYPGGDEALKAFIKENIVFKDAEKAKTYKGIIPIRYKVKEDGSLGQFTLQATIDADCDHALIMAMSKAKGFKAALDQDGKPLSAWLTVDIEFPIEK